MSPVVSEGVIRGFPKARFETEYSFSKAAVRMLSARKGVYTARLKANLELLKYH